MSTSINRSSLAHLRLPVADSFGRLLDQLQHNFPVTFRIDLDMTP